MKPITITYCFKINENREETFSIELDPETVEQVERKGGSKPDWARIQFEQCSNCSLDVAGHEYCPLVVSLIDIIERFADILSYDEIDIDVITEERTISTHTSAQNGISSLMGLLMATSGCPHTQFLKPMARFHLPFSSEDETMYRATSMYLLAQYFVKKEGKDADIDLIGLTEKYEKLHSVNVAIARRIRAAIQKDATVNALIILDVYAKMVPLVIEEALDEIRHIFSPYLKKNLEE